MPTGRSRQPRSFRSRRRTALASRFLRSTALLSAAAAVLGWAVGGPAASAHDLADAGDFQSLLVDTTALAGWLCLVWAATVLLLEAAARLPGAVGRLCDAAAALAAPRAARRVAQALLGITVAAGPLMSGVALATPSASDPISLDRPAVVAGPTAAAPPVVAPGPTAPDLDRPAGRAFIPPAPAPARAQAKPDPAGLVTAGGRRTVVDEGYVVRRGDTLWDVAARHLGPAVSPADIARDWPQWYAANRAVIGSDPNLLRPGEVLHPPVG